MAPMGLWQKEQMQHFKRRNGSGNRGGLDMRDKGEESSQICRTGAKEASPVINH